MINPTTYEALSYPLELASEEVVFVVSQELVKLNKSIIKDPDNIAKYRKIYNKRMKEIAKKFGQDAVKWADEYVSKAYLEGLKSADHDLKALGKGGKATGEIERGTYLIKKHPVIPIPPIPGQILAEFKGFEAHTEFFNVFRQAAYYGLSDKPFQILRKSDDIFRKVSIMAGEKNFKEGDVLTRRQLSQDMLNEYADRGLQCIRYKDGRLVSIDSYCEMYGRTMTGRCALQSTLNRYVERGYELGIVSAHFRSCDLCAPYEGTILSMDGKDTRYPSVWDAETQGLWHPACKHDVSVWFEGISEPIETRVDPAEQSLIDEHGYEDAQKLSYAAQQKQRYIERKIRQYKRRESVALDDKSKNVAKKKIREWQAAQRVHLSNNTYLKRKPVREQIKKAH